MARVIAFDVNETLMDLSALDEPFEALFGSPALRPQWFALMLQLSFVGGLTGRYVDFGAAQRAALAMLAEREGVPVSTGDIEALVPEDVSADFSAHSVLGRVQHDFPLQPKHSRFSAEAGRSFFGTVGKAASEVVLRSFSGKIRLKQR